MRPLLLDLFCGAGGASVGYHRAGFDVIGIDINPQPRYPFPFIQADALGGMVEAKVDWEGYAAIHASPPCQAFTRAKQLQGNAHPDLLRAVRELLAATGKPYVIENVPGAPLINPTTLCGMMFGLNVYRHRLFESNVPLPLIMHPPHHKKQVKMGRPVREGDIIQVVGCFSGIGYARKAMGISWMTRDELAQAIPPAYTEWIGKQIIGLCEQRGAA